MTKFDEAAEHASFDVRTEYAPLLGTYGVVISEKSAQKITEIISKHYAEIEAGHKKLVELAEIVPQILEMNMQMAEQLYGRDEEGGIPIPQIVSVAYSIVDDPQVKVAIERSKGNV